MYDRIISLAPSNTEILFALGLGNKIVGITTFCDYPEETKNIEKIGSWIYVNDLNKLFSLKPDVILTSMYVPPKIKDWAEQNGIRLLNLFPQTIEGIYDSILRIGIFFNKGLEAKELITDIRVNLENIRIRSKDIMKKPKIYSEEYHKPPTVAGNWVPQLIKIAGGKPMIKEGKLSPEASLKEVEKFDPDIIVLHWCGFQDKSKKEDLIKRGWHLRAVKENNVFSVNDTFLNRPGPRIWKGAKLIHDLINNANLRHPKI